MSEQINPAIHPAISPAVNPAGIDAYAPAEMAHRIETAGVSKAALATLPLLALAVLAGAFIAFGGMFYLVAITDSGLGFGPTRLLGGLAFSLGLVLVVVGGAELFTGNNLIVMGWAHGTVPLAGLLRNWFFSYAGNFAGAVAMAFLASLSGFLMLGGGAVLDNAVAIAKAKTELPFVTALVRGILCNTLVCLAVWLCFSARTAGSKILCIVFPISAFVALGFEHSIANMFFIPLAMFAGAEGVTVGGLVANLVPVTVGNVIGGGVFVAFTYYVIYLRGRP
ncbi:MAG: formate/nitrite transporter family protein [Rhodospirillales bacterium]